MRSTDYLPRDPLVPRTCFRLFYVAQMTTSDFTKPMNASIKKHHRPFAIYQMTGA